MAASGRAGEVVWGIIGCGDVCERKAGPALYGVPGSRLVAVMRRDAARAADFARRHAVARWYASVDELLADPEPTCIYVATPDAAHAEMTIRAARAGKHVLVEKAMATSAADCSEMIAVCREAGVTLAVAYYRRCYPSILRARALLDSGELGRLRRLRINDEFPLSHRLDLMHFFAGDAARIRIEPAELPPASHAPRGPMLHVLHTAGAESITPLGWDENLVPEVLDLEAENGRIRILDLKQGLLIVEQPGRPKQREQPGPLPATHWGLVQNFVAHLLHGAALACDGVEGRKSTVILDLVGQLAEGGGQAAVNYA